MANVRDLHAVPMKKQEAEAGDPWKNLRAGSLALTAAMKKKNPSHKAEGERPEMPSGPHKAHNHKGTQRFKNKTEQQQQQKSQVGTDNLFFSKNYYLTNKPQLVQYLSCML